MTPDLVAGIAAVLAIGAAGVLLVCVFAALTPVPADGAPRRPDDPETTRRVPAEWMRQVAAEGERRRREALLEADRDRRLAALTAPAAPVAVVASAPVVARGTAILPKKQVTTCPTCSAPLPGLLAACPKPDCLREATAYETRLDRGWDL